MKKKHSVSKKDKKDWISFTKDMGDIFSKDPDLLNKNQHLNKVRKLDLHGYSLNEANKVIKKFIIKSYSEGYKKLLIVTGKGMRSKSYDNPYVSEKLNTLRYSVPEFVKSDKNLMGKISKILKADIKDGGEGAIYIFLKNNKEFIE